VINNCSKGICQIIRGCTTDPSKYKCRKVLETVTYDLNIEEFVARSRQCPKVMVEYSIPIATLYTSESCDNFDTSRQYMLE